MELFKSSLSVITLLCFLLRPVELQSSQVARQNGTKTSDFVGINQNKTKLRHPADYDLCGKPSRSMDKALIPELHPTLGVWPWMALIGYTTPRSAHFDFKCEAILISKQWVLTAAHCVLTYGSLTPHFVRLGVVQFDNTLNSSTEQNDFPIEAVITHPKFSLTVQSDDLALIRLKIPVNYTEYIRPICLLGEPKFKIMKEYYKEKWIDIVGYDIQTDDQSVSLELRRWMAKISNQTECAALYSKYKTISIDEKLICVKRNGDDVCEKTFGGALLFQNVTERRFYLGGISSFGGPCFLGGNPPNTYTIVTNFIDWIAQVTGEKFF